MSAEGGERLAAAVAGELAAYACRGRRERREAAGVMGACPTLGRVARAGGFDEPLRASAPWGPPERRALAAMAASGLTDAEMAARLMRTAQAVRAKRESLGIPKTRRKR